MRKLDEVGTYEPEAVKVGLNGEAQIIAGRGAFVDAEELVEMIRGAVSDELDHFLDQLMREIHPERY